MTTQEETLRRLVVELRILEGTADALQSRINLVSATLTELRISTMTLEGMEKEREGALLFVPIGGGSYVKSKLESVDRVIVGIGAGVAIERTIKEAMENIGNRIADLEKTRNTLQQQLGQVVGKIEEGRNKFQELSAKLSEEARRSDVRKTERGT
ncbi:MAG: Prefoldin subunit alpha [Candidatus Bathyarchaeota archaeon BA1]|nr:MAG: Prefoldin subunit alpha [Candidatus Bathyarchaeota archaeon BA1]